MHFVRVWSSTKICVKLDIWQLSKKVQSSPDNLLTNKCHITILQAKVYISLRWHVFLKFSANQLLIFNNQWSIILGGILFAPCLWKSWITAERQFFWPWPIASLHIRILNKIQSKWLTSLICEEKVQFMCSGSKRCDNEFVGRVVCAERLERYSGR